MNSERGISGNRILRFSVCRFGLRCATLIGRKAGKPRSVIIECDTHSRCGAVWTMYQSYLSQPRACNALAFALALSAWRLSRIPRGVRGRAVFFCGSTAIGEFLVRLSRSGHAKTHCGLTIGAVCHGGNEIFCAWPAFSCCHRCNSHLAFGF